MDHSFGSLTGWLTIDPDYPDAFPLASFTFRFVFSLTFCHFLRPIMVLLAGSSTGWLPISQERLKELVDAQEAVHSVISDYLAKKGKSLEESIHALPGLVPFRPNPDRKPLADYQFVNVSMQTLILFIRPNMHVAPSQGFMTPSCPSTHHALPLMEACTHHRVQEHSMPNGDHRRSQSTASDRSESGNNPEALSFTPGGGLIVRGVRTPQEFMASLRAIQARSGVRITVPPRRIIFGNLPNATTISDVLCLVYGGAVERAWSVVDGEVIVQFCDDGACRRYYDANSTGIIVFGDHVIALERPDDTDQLTAAQRERINEGITRVIRITGITNDSFGRLCDLTKGYEIDHIHLVECDKVRQTPFFF